MRASMLLFVCGIACLMLGCATPAARMKHIRLGMTPDEVLKEVGEPYTVRAGKIFDDGRTTMVWEYMAQFSIWPKDYWVYFENDKVVQWGEPNDLSGATQTDLPVIEYSPARSSK